MCQKQDKRWDKNIQNNCCGMYSGEGEPASKNEMLKTHFRSHKAQAVLKYQKQRAKSRTYQNLR